MKSEKNRNNKPPKVSKITQNKLSKEPSPYKKIISGYKNYKNHKRSFIFASFIFLLLYLWIYLFSWVITSQFSLTANIKAVSGGYALSYDICTIPLEKFEEDIKPGDKIYINQNLQIKKIRRKCIEMKVDKISEGIVTLSFVPKDVPTFITTNEYLNLLESSLLNTRLTNTVKVTGKIMANRFITYKIEFLNQKGG